MVTSTSTTTYSVCSPISQHIVVRVVDTTIYSVYAGVIQMYASGGHAAPALEEIGGGQRRPRERGSMPRGRGGHASRPGSARGTGGAPERERRREEERSACHAKMSACRQTRQNRPRIAPGSGYAGIWSRPRNAHRGRQRPPEKKILPETCSRLERTPEAWRRCRRHAGSGFILCKMTMKKREFVDFYWVIPILTGKSLRFA